MKKEKRSRVYHERKKHFSPLSTSEDSHDGMEGTPSIVSDDGSAEGTIPFPNWFEQIQQADVLAESSGTSVESVNSSPPAVSEESISSAHANPVHF